MSEKDKAQIMEALSDLPEEKKQFVLGYAAGIAAKSETDKTGSGRKGRDSDAMEGSEIQQ